ncbi:MAG TPA: protein kinase, partial [Pseudomonadales bacterium]|nr:protein kinase [Pseudomonadales bacterium]
MGTERICPNCRKPLPPDVPLELCPECLIKAGFPTGTEPGSGGIGRFVPPPIEEIAKLFPQFEILSLIGKGGMGAVYKARQPALDRFVALKVLPPAVANDPGFAERFNREARALARLSHPNIVVVYDFGTAGTLNYLVMEFVDGTNLREIEQAGKLSAEQALAIVPQICEALQFAHNEGIVHRDIKPENLLIDKKGRLKITDFGIAKILDVATGKVALTGAKDVVGTPHYMAPEQIEKPQTVDHRADIYSLGVVFYEMLTGELPLGKFSPPSKKVQVDVRLDEVVLHTLEKEPERRYQQASQVKTDVETIAGTPPPIGGVAPPISPTPSQEATSDKILLPTFLLAFFFGWFGAHRFYVGKIGTGIAQLFTLGGLGIWATIDWILILCKVFTDGKGRRITNWWHPGPSHQPAPPKMPEPPIAKGTPSDVNPTMIIAPAVALLVAGCMKLFGALMALLFFQFGWSITPLTSAFGHIGFPIIGFHWGILAVFSTILFSVTPALVIIYGAVEMMRIRSYGWA